ncbi:hypothetical protein A6V39_04140 [Candidatus Mycoplasma haematobovis]|uniref:DNA-3-methyladenine glycosylase II n=1 Tax=Candidatus Mycoplasma haematobovis TaxID=432608 RepID=A0A1A9QEE7_9MOLU|nr:DNA-3-methyladenine glycosylase [Candidatus Mycoplasma haematobovis]OAL10079.1 hypothetical protein A6V39_04140 [Candidatus Mycoplasma haematobovis]
MFFPFKAEALDYLRKKDPYLSKFIDKYGVISRPIKNNVFEAIVNSILGQQISTSVTRVIWKRVKDKVGEVTPDSISALTIEELRACGTSFKKASNLLFISQRFKLGEFDSLNTMNDEEVCNKLCELPGVGRWTAEMVMIHALLREDVLSYGDAGIKKGLRIIYGIDKVTPEIFKKCKELYSPYGTIASFYIWRVANDS